MKNKITTLACLIVFSACTKSVYAPDYSGSLTASTRTEALNLLPEESRLRYEGWKAGLVKGCTVANVFEGGASEFGSVDLKMFFAKTGNSLFLKASESEIPKDKDGKLVDWENPDFVIFGQPNLNVAKSGSDSEIATTKNSRNAKIKIRTHLENGLCDVYVGEYRVDSIVMAVNIPVIAYSTQAKREKYKIQSLPLSAKVSKRGMIKFSDSIFTSLGFAMLSVYPVTGEFEERDISNTDQEVADFVTRELGALERNNVFQYFQLEGLNTSHASVEFVGRVNEIPFGFMNQTFYAYERSLRDLKDSKTHALTTSWKFRPPLVKIPDPENPGAFVGNEAVDKNDWIFEVATSMVGSLDQGGNVELKKFTLKVPSEVKSESAAACFAKRSFAARILTTITESQQIPVNWYEISSVCLGSTNNLIKDILESGGLATSVPSPDSNEVNELTAIEEFRTILRFAKPSRTFNYWGWDYQFKELVNVFMNGEVDKDLGNLDPNNNVPLVTASKRNFTDIKEALDGSGAGSGELKLGLRQYLELALQAALVNFDLRQLDILAKIRESSPHTRGILAESYRNYIQQLAGLLTVAPKNDQKDQLWENLKSHVEKMDQIAKLPTDFEAKLVQADQLARKLGLSAWADTNTKNFLSWPGKTLDPERVENWIESLNALESFYVAENTRLGGQAPSKAYWRNDFQFRFMNERWNRLTLRYLERFSAVVSFIPQCAKEKDVVSRLWCSNASNISGSQNGVLFPRSRDRLWELSNELERMLPRLPSGDEVAARVARQFFSPIFQNCGAENFRIKVKNLMSFLVRYSKNPAAEKAQSDFESRINQVFAACN